MKYYILPKNEIGQRNVMDEKEGRPADMTGVNIVDLPYSDSHLEVKGKIYPAGRVARAIHAGQISLDDINQIND